jgi:uncharacterized surface protein with fasciclin (FAS1) repeats
MNIRSTIVGLVSIAGLSAGLALADGCTAGYDKSKQTEASASKQTIVETAVAAGSFKTLAAALGAAGLVETLQGSGPFTVFAPTDEAFAKLPAGTVQTLLKPENKAKLASILTYHVVPGNVMAADVVKLSSATTVNGQRVDIGVKGGAVMLDGGSTVTKTDIACSNGVIHVIDTVILPEEKNILEVAGAAGSFTTLAAAIKAAGLGEALSGKGPFTVFAPTDEAFRKLPAGTVETLLKPENKDKLAAVLKLHVLPGAVYADGVTKISQTPATLQGQKLSVMTNGSAVSLGNNSSKANIAATDVEASNGVIHIIDSVLLPE